MNKSFFTWDAIERGSDFIADFLRDKEVGTVIGIARGGVIPSSLVSRILETDLITLNAKSYNENNERGRLTINMTGLNIIRPGNIAIIDDICDSGYTLDAFKKSILQIYPNKKIYTCSLLNKKNLVHTPNCFYREILCDEWAVFPWEKD